MAESFLLKLSKIIEAWADILQTKYQFRKQSLANGKTVLQEEYLFCLK